MELRHLRYFVAVAEAENVSRAALTLHVSQPAVSRQIRDLEEEIGFSLFERTAKSVRLTQAGRVFLSEACAVLQRAEAAVKAARHAATGQAGELDVGCAMSPTVRILPPALRAFQASFPSVRVKLHDLSTTEMLAGLREGRLPIAFLVRGKPAMLRGWSSLPVAKIGILLAVAPRHPLARRRQVTLPEIARYPLITFNRADYPDYHQMLDSLFAGSRDKLRVLEEHDSVAGLVAAVEAGSGVALLTETMSCVTGARLKLTPIFPPPEPLTVVAVWPKGDLPGAAKQFLECVKEIAAKASQ